MRNRSATTARDSKLLHPVRSALFITSRPDFADRLGGQRAQVKAESIDTSSNFFQGWERGTSPLFHEHQTQDRIALCKNRRRFPDDLDQLRNSQSLIWSHNLKARECQSEIVGRSIKPTDNCPTAQKCRKPAIIDMRQVHSPRWRTQCPSYEIGQRICADCPDCPHGLESSRRHVGYASEILEVIYDLPFLSREVRGCNAQPLTQFFAVILWFPSPRPKRNDTNRHQNTSCQNDENLSPSPTRFSCVLVFQSKFRFRIQKFFTPLVTAVLCLMLSRAFIASCRTQGSESTRAPVNSGMAELASL